MTTVYLIRHGQTFANEQNILQGRSESELTQKGIRQVEFLSKRLKHIKFSHCYTSSLSRTFQTGTIITNGRDLRITKDALINERSYGIFEGKSKTKLQEFTKNKLKSINEKDPFKDTKFTLHKSIESNHNMYLRTKLFLDKVTQKHPNQTILAISHGGIIRSLLEHMGILTRNYYTKTKIPNTCAFIIKCTNKDIVFQNKLDI